MTTAPDDSKQAVIVPLTRTQKVLAGVVGAAAIFIAILGFAGSYTAVAALAATKGFGWFAHAFPAAVDAGIIAFLALDLLLTWLRMRLPLLRHSAWGLTAATIAFNAAAAWPDALGVGMHAVIPILFVIVVEAARHAIGRIANIVADKHMESPRLIRWLLAPWPTFRIWRRQRLWELRSYEDVLTLEREAIQYRQILRSVHGRNWRRQADPGALLALHFAKYGTPIAETLARQDAELAAASKRQQDRQNTASTTPVDRQDTANDERQNTASGPATGASTTASDRQHHRQEATPGDTDTANTAAKKTASTTAKSSATSDNTRQKPTPGAAKKAASKSTPGASTRRSQAEWVDVAGPVFDRQRAELGKVPSGRQFADAIASEGLGDVSESTAKNIRQWVLQADALPAN